MCDWVGEWEWWETKYCWWGVSTSLELRIQSNTVDDLLKAIDQIESRLTKVHVRVPHLVAKQIYEANRKNQ